MTCPMLRIKTGIILCQEGVASVAKNGFYKIKVTHEIARSKEAHLETFFTDEALDFGDNNRTQE